MNEDKIRKKLVENGYYVTHYGLILRDMKSEEVLGDLRRSDKWVGKLFGIPRVVLSNPIGQTYKEIKECEERKNELEKILIKEHIPYR
jgi:hypothetical protein